jgi:serine/threonine protein kinase
LGLSCLQVGIYKALLDTASGLDYLHSIGVVHGDLKTANVLLKGSTRDARGVTCKITDFGLSRVLDPEATHISTGTYGECIFTVEAVSTADRGCNINKQKHGVSATTVLRPFAGRACALLARQFGFSTNPKLLQECGLQHPVTSALMQTPLAFDGGTASMLSPAAGCRHDCVHAQGAAAVRPHDTGHRHLLIRTHE